MSNVSEYQVGETIGGEFLVHAVFGGVNRSGMGVVYLVDHRELPFPIILKTPQTQLDTASRQRFQAEATAWILAGAHRHVVQAFWVREIANQLFVAAEYVAPDSEGRNTLAQHIAQGPIPVEVLLKWAVQFCLGMEYVQARGVLAHRDVKPNNLLIDTRGDLKVTDFGLAKALKLDSELSKHADPQIRGRPASPSISNTRTGVAMGTVPFMAPELFLDAKSADHRADIYAFGIVLYEAITGGRYPYSVNSQIDLIEDFRDVHLHRIPEPADSPLWPVIAHCLAKSPSERYESYDALLNDIRRCARSLRVLLPASTHIERNDEELYAEAQSYVALGDAEKALRCIEEYVSKYPGNPCGWTEKGRIHLERDEDTDSLHATKRSLDLDPYNSHAWNNLGIALTRTNAPFAQIKFALERALYLDPQNTSAMLNFIGPLVCEKQFLLAAELLAKAIKLRPEKPLVVDKASTLLKECFAHHHLDAADALLTGWVIGRPSDADAWHNLGLIHLHYQRLEAAIDAFKHVETISPDDNFAIKQLASLLFQSGQFEECIVRCSLLIKRDHERTYAISLRSEALRGARSGSA
jgi:serine/threonine protein kinase